MKMTDEQFAEFEKTLPIHKDFEVEYKQVPDPNISGSHFFVIGVQHFGDIYVEPEKAPCAMRRCSADYNDDVHRIVRIGMATIKRDATEKELAEYLLVLKEAFANGDVEISGFGFPNHKEFMIIDKDGLNVFA